MHVIVGKLTPVLNGLLKQSRSAVARCYTTIAKILIIIPVRNVIMLHYYLLTNAFIKAALLIHLFPTFVRIGKRRPGSSSSCCVVFITYLWFPQLVAVETLQAKQPLTKLGIIHAILTFAKIIMVAYVRLVSL